MLRVNVDGAGNWPYEGLRGQRWAGLFDVGAGLTARLGRQLSVAVELHGQLAAPYPTVRFSGEEVARIGRPALFSSLTLVMAAVSLPAPRHQLGPCAGTTLLVVCSRGLRPGADRSRRGLWP